MATGGAGVIAHACGASLAVRQLDRIQPGEAEALERPVGVANLGQAIEGVVGKSEVVARRSRSPRAHARSVLGELDHRLAAHR